MTARISESTSEETKDRFKRNSSGVGLMSIALVGLSWLALVLAPNPNGQDNAERSSFKLQDSLLLPGFRADVAFLPDERMLGFVEIPGGEFLMGSDPEQDSLSFDLEWWGSSRVSGRPDEPTFFMSRYEVTVAQYATFLSSSKHPVTTPQAISAPPDHPVTWVAWTDAVAYAAWLDDEIRTSAAEGLLAEPIATLLLTGWRVSLPSEAQWEKAARGIDGRIYPWGDEPEPDFATYLAGGTTAVGSSPCPRCAHGLSDMSGNVWEWTVSPYQPYPFTDEDDLETLRMDALWVMRGGSFGDPEQMIRAANRGGADPGARRPFIGFRVALVPG